MKIRSPLFLRLLVLGAASWQDATAHRSLPEGISCSSQFHSPETALVVPNPTVSWASYRIFDCEQEVFWLEANASADQTLHFTALVPVLERFANVRMSAAFIGPSLPALEAGSETDTDLPAEIRDYIDSTGMGVALFHSPQDQSTCDHLTSDAMIMESSVVDGRCHFLERFGGSNSWVLLDENLTVEQEGTYKIAVFVEGGTTTKASFACCDWPEDFVTEYDIPDVDCPICGTSPDENLAWMSYFYEQKEMASYGGFPPYEVCETPPQDLDPAEEQCPPATEPDPDTQPSSCTLGCNAAGLCHSHNVFGECTHNLEWNLQPKFGDAPVSKVIIFKGDKIKFQDSESAHNVFEMPSQVSFDACDFADAAATANVEEVFVGHTITFDEAGTFYFTCGIGCTSFPTGEDSSTARQGCHCELGQKLEVEVKDSSDGIRCHDHAPFINDEAEDLTCTEGQVLAFTIDNSSYGAMDETECAEFCTPPAALQFMTGVQEGSCANVGFSGSTMVKTVMLANGQQVTVHVTSNKEPEMCHCHSYEEIACPADELPEDTLYDEHIDEITQFCTGIVAGTENDCPFKCFQPMEVLHLHYIACPDRPVDPMYLAVNATAKCHIAATAPEGTDCPVVTFDGDITSTPEPTTPVVPSSVMITPIHFHGCMQSYDDEDKVLLAACNAGNAMQQWQYDASTGLIQNSADMMCMQAGYENMPPRDGGFVRLMACNENEALQKFDWPSPTGSPITVATYPEYCVTFRGGHADLGVDPIIVKKCTNIEKARRDGWMKV